ncbi:MAG: hypothetical protein QOI77_2594 [Blastocatellia bacterium]|nr:hypothetical protein [Blastocatellia bacterium]
MGAPDFEILYRCPVRQSLSAHQAASRYRVEFQAASLSLHSERESEPLPTLGLGQFSLALERIPIRAARHFPNLDRRLEFFHGFVLVIEERQDAAHRFVRA